MAAIELQKQWAELEPNRGFSFENFERNAKLIKNKVINHHFENRRPKQ